MEIIERIKEIIKEKFGERGENLFSKEIGIPQVSLNNYTSGRRKVSYEVIDAILSAFPDVSAEWLLRGEGKMYKSEMAEDETPMVIKGESGFMILDMPVETFCNELIANTRMFREQLILVNERNQILKDEIERLQQLREKKRG
uniref:helix-turn-helix domain-containing protein n=1 Tax=Bacteroides cellulosilyticus TaxID=246787 RepID=UPI003FEFA9F1